jgi:hypothetical protein
MPMNNGVRRCGNTWMYCSGNCSSCPYNTTTAVDSTPLKMSGIADAKTVQYVELSQEMIDKIADAVVRRIKDERTD